MTFPSVGKGGKRNSFVYSTAKEICLCPDLCFLFLFFKIACGHVMYSTLDILFVFQLIKCIAPALCERLEDV